MRGDTITKEIVSTVDGTHMVLEEGDICEFNGHTIVIHNGKLHIRSNVFKDGESWIRFSGNGFPIIETTGRSGNYDIYEDSISEYEKDKLNKIVDGE